VPVENNISPLGQTMVIPSVIEKPEEPVKTVSKIPFSTLYDTDHLKFIIVPGNNSKLIKEAMKQRKGWIECPPFNSVYNFKWCPTS
jgi:hypothetical protein